jgi:hypothetical protein
MKLRSVLDSWIGLSDDSKHKRLRQTMLDGWVVPNNVIQPNEQQLHSPTLPLPLNLDIDAEHNNAAVDLLMPALISDSDDSSISSDRDESDPMLEIAPPPSDGYLWNLVPPVSYQYLDSSTIHTTDSSRSNSSDGNQSDDSFVCDDDVVYTTAEVLTLTKMFPKTAHLFNIDSVRTPGYRFRFSTED